MMESYFVFSGKRTAIISWKALRAILLFRRLKITIFNIYFLKSSLMVIPKLMYLYVKRSNNSDHCCDFVSPWVKNKTWHLRIFSNAVPNDFCAIFSFKQHGRRLLRTKTWSVSFSWWTSFYFATRASELDTTVNPGTFEVFNRLSIAS